MATAESVKQKIQNLISAANGATGRDDADLTAAVNALMAGFGQGGGSGSKVTEYVVTENTDRSLWLNQQSIRLVKGVNLMLLGGWLYGGSVVDNTSGLTTMILMLWDGTAISESAKGTTDSSNHIRGFHLASNGHTLVSSAQSLRVGNTSKVSVGADGLLSFITSATGVTTGNYANSFMGAGNVYYLFQRESEEIC